MGRARQSFTALIIVLGTATFLYLLWSFGPLVIWGHLRSFGWGFALVLPFQVFDHGLNALGWRLTFPPAAAAKTSLLDLIRVRVAGDGVNYLTPSGNIAGEFIRPGMLAADLPSEVKVTSVLVAKASQAIGQALFVLFGLLYLLHGRLYEFQSGQVFWASLGMLVILFGVAFCVAVFAAEPPAWLRERAPGLLERTASVRRLVREDLSKRAGRLSGSVALFMAGYAWGAAEIWLIARLLGYPLSPETCLSIEFLSNLVDSLAFMVPAKIGTQEAGKTAIFKGLGLRPDIGFVVGFIRHLREVAWAGLGLLLYAAHQRRAAAAKG